MKEIYLDHAATTKLDERVLQKMMPYFTEYYGNANSQHGMGRDAQKAVDEARDEIAKLIGAQPNEIYFTSGGTEADNWVLRGICKALSHKGKHIITTKIEHAAMLSTAKELEKEGYEFTFLNVDNDGFVDLTELEKSIRPDTILVSCMYANNEIGTIEPIKKIAEIAHAHGVLCHTDAVQAMGAMRINVRDLGVDMMSFSAHKFNGPKGMGALFIKTGVPVGRLISGGHQERTRRGGTTNVPGVVGFAEALRLTYETLDEDVKHVAALRDRFVRRVLEEVPYVKFNGPKDMTKRLPNNADFSFEYIEGESILFSLDLAGIAVSSGSACSSGSLEPSHVLLAIGVPEELAHGSIRFTFGKENTKEEVDYTVEKIKETVERLRKMSPLFKLDGTLKEV